MHNISESGVSYPTAVSVPDDAVDFRTAASLYPSLTALANRARFIGLLLGVDVDGTRGGTLNTATLSALICDILVKADHLIGISYIHSFGTLQVDGASTLQAVACTTLSASGSLSCASISGVGTISCVTLNTSGQIFANGGLNVPPGSFLSVAAQSTLTAPFVCSSNGYVTRNRTRRTTGSAINDLVPGQTAIVAATGGLTLTLPTTTQDGAWVEVQVTSNTNTVTVNDPSVGTILAMKVASGFYRYALFMYDSGLGQYITLNSTQVP